MAKRLFVAVLAAAFVASFAACAVAASWTKIGTSGFTTSPNLMQDPQRIRFNSIAFDAAGNIYATAVNGNNTGMAGGLTIYKPNGSGGYNKIDVDVNALGFPGGITKLVRGGDGAVYGLQNWLEIGWSYTQGVNRILRFDANGGVTEIWNAGPASDANRITGMTVGGDGNIYWTMNGADGYWKYHFLWRYDVGGGAVEESPLSGNQGWGQTTRMFNLEYVGAAPMFGSDLAVLSSGSSNWGIDKMSWTVARDTDGTCNPGWGRDWITATAANLTAGQRAVWAGGRGAGSGPWKWFGDNGSATISDGTIRVTKGNSTYYRLDLPSVAENQPVTTTTIASRFALDSYSPDYNGNILQIRAPGYHAIASLAVSGGNYVLKDTVSTLVTLGPANVGQFNAAYIVVDGSTEHVECWWNGEKKFDGTASSQATYNWAGALFGTSVRDGQYAGTATAVFDWVAASYKRVAPGEAWPGLLAYYLDGNTLPDRYRTTNIMSRWTPMVWTQDFFPTDVCANWHANGNDPDNGTPNGGVYWVNTVALQPATGDAWMAWGAESSYNYDQIGTVWVRTRDALSLGWEGVPEDGAQVVAIGFNGGKVYAVTCNLTTGAYSLYSKTPGSNPDTIAAVKQGPAGRSYSTDEPKLVTYPVPMEPTTYFYIEDADRASGIKVIPDSGQPVAKVGDKAMVAGRLGVVNGEAVIYASSVVISSAGSDAIKPLATTVRNVGGGQLGLQPPTLQGGSSSYAWPMGLNTTGLLIRVSGKLVVSGFDEFVDDGSQFPLRIEWGPGTGALPGDQVTITGVSGVTWDGANGFRVIMPRDYNDIQID